MFLPGWAHNVTILLVMQHADNRMRFRMGRSFFTLFRRGMVAEPEPGYEIHAQVEGSHELTRDFARRVNGIALGSIGENLLNLPTTAHILGGVKDGKRQVPCLYDQDLQALPGPSQEVFASALINLGYWDPLSCHYREYGVPPPGISSWTRMRLGWLDPAKVHTVAKGERAEVVLGPLEDASSETLAIRIPLSATTYYLVENRQPIGVDRYLPGSGVLILYADDSIAECRHGQAPVKLMNADPTVPLLNGAAFDVGAKGEFVDDRNGIAIRVAEKIGSSYRIVIGPL
jgi:hypothetical protein